MLVTLGVRMPPLPMSLARRGKKTNTDYSSFHVIVIVAALLSIAYIPADSIVSFATQVGAGRKNGALKRFTGRYLDPGNSSFT